MEKEELVFNIDNKQNDLIFLKQLNDCVENLNILDERISSLPERTQRIDYELSDWLHYIQNNEVDDNTLINVSKRIRELRQIRASLHNESLLIKRYKDLSNRMMSPDNRQFLVSEIQKVRSNFYQPYNNRIINDDDINGMKVIKLKDGNEKVEKKHKGKRTKKEMEEVYDKIYDMLETTKNVSLIARTVGCNRATVEKCKHNFNVGGY